MFLLKSFLQLAFTQKSCFFQNKGKFSILSLCHQLCHSRRTCSLPLSVKVQKQHKGKPMAEDQAVNEVSEGLAKVFLPASVFYNPVQEYNRDLTIAVISEFAEIRLSELKDNKKGKRNRSLKEPAQDGVSFALSENVSEDTTNSLKAECSLLAGKCHANGLKIFEGLAASGLRSVRFGLEIPGVQTVIANDFDKNAVSFIQRNIEKNNLGDLMQARHGDAAMGMYEHREVGNRFDVIDLDPYGSASMFLDAAVQAVEEGGLLCVTCTDAAVLCGNAPEKCNANYGSFSLRSKFCHEMGIRIILQCLDSHANRYSRYIEPLISLSIDFYFRVFVRVYTGQKQVKQSATKKSMVYECVGCGSYMMQPLAVAVPCKGEGNFKYMPGIGPTVPEKCVHCGHQHRIGGPIWSAPLHNLDFVRQVIARVQAKPEAFATKDRILGMLNLVLEELPDVPLYYVLDAVCGVMHCSPPNMIKVRSAILNAGYRVSLSHAAKNSYKTDAPNQLIWDIMRAWVKDHPISEKRLTEGSVPKTILDGATNHEVFFDEHPEANPQSREVKLLRWQTNPEPNWGPKAKAKRMHDTGVDPTEKRLANQGKKKKRGTEKTDGQTPNEDESEATDENQACQ